MWLEMSQVGSLGETAANAAGSTARLPSDVRMFVSLCFCLGTWDTREWVGGLSGRAEVCVCVHVRRVHVFANMPVSVTLRNLSL